MTERDRLSVIGLRGRLLTSSLAPMPARSGRKGPPPSLTVAVEVLDSRSVYGREEWLVRPVGGEGEAWVVAERVDTSIEPAPEAAPRKGEPK